ncbi:MAG: ParA family protein [Bacteroidales bacterium]|nr:ParA family protein [Bacteroidales bacterium]
MGKIIAISNHKGGVGKTTTTVNLGAGLAREGKKILLVDLDPQANLTQCFGITKPEATVYEALKGEEALNPVMVIENLYIAPSSLDLAGAEMELSSEAGREYLLDEILTPLKDDYDYLLVDCPPSLGLLTLNAFTCADEVIIPIQAHFLAIKGLTKIIEIINKVKRRINKTIEISGVVITLYDGRKVLHRDIEETIKTYFQEKVYNTKIRQNIALAEAPTRGEDIFRYSANSNGAFDYEKLSQEFIERHKEKKLKNN